MSAKFRNAGTRFGLVIILFFLGGWLGSSSALSSGTILLAWPLFSIALAAILLFGYRFWPGVILGAAMCSLMNIPLLMGSKPLLFILGSAMGNTAAALICAYLLNRFVQFDRSLERVRDVAGFVGLTCLLGATINAALDVVSLFFMGQISIQSFLQELQKWWAPNAIGALVVGSVILTWASPSCFQWRKGIIVEALLCGFGLAGALWLSFDSSMTTGSYPLAYLPYPFLIWGTLRFGPRGATTGTFIASFLSIYSLVHGRGPFVSPSAIDSVMMISSYIGILAITNMLLAAMTSERTVAEQAIRKILLNTALSN